MKLFLDEAIFKAIALDEYGGVNGFLEAWRDGELHARRDEAPSRATLYDWIANGLPRDESKQLALFSAIAQDPTSIIDWQRSGLFENFSCLRLQFIAGKSGSFSALFRLFQPSSDWPHQPIALSLFNKPWATFQFSNDALTVKNVYTCISLKLIEESQIRPSSVHIAYRTMTNADGLWRPYGTVIRRSDADYLFHENGNRQSASYRKGDAIRFETFLGPSPVEFRIASLSDFKAEHSVQDQAVLRFHGR